MSWSLYAKKVDIIFLYMSWKFVQRSMDDPLLFLTEVVIWADDIFDSMIMFVT